MTSPQRAPHPTDLNPHPTDTDLHPADLNPRLIEIRTRKAERRAVRVAFAARRQRGLEHRHAQRLHNLEVARQPTANQEQSPTAGDT
jgi:hypothetical protein